MNDKLKRMTSAVAFAFASMVCVAVYATILSIPYFSQLDSRWSGVTVPGSGGTIKTKGCAVTSTAMGLAFRGADVDPGKLCRWLSSNGGFTSDGKIIWDVAGRYNGRRWLTYESSGQIISLADLSRQIDNRKLIIAESNRFRSHFVIIRGVTPDGKYGYYWDPADLSATQRRIDDGYVNIGAGTRVFSY